MSVEQRGGYRSAFENPVRTEGGQVRTISSDAEMQIREFNPDHPDYETAQQRTLMEILDSPDATPSEVLGAIGVNLEDMRRAELNPESLLAGEESSSNEWAKALGSMSMK